MLRHAFLSRKGVDGLDQDWPRTMALLMKEIMRLITVVLNVENAEKRYEALF